MKYFYKRVSQIAILALSVSFIVACGGGGGSSTDTNTTTDTTITHNGVEYKTVTSPTTSRVWLDRNLGAARVCESKTDIACYGDYYQWGRPADGHEDSQSSTTTTRVNDVTNTGSNAFIESSDWVNSGVDNNGALRSAKWSLTDGTSICPVGFRVPTKDELNAEFSSIHNVDEAFNSFLKLPVAGYRDRMNGNVVNLGVKGYLWTSNPLGTLNAYHHYYNNTSASSSNARRGYGFPVRCIKN